MQAVTRKAGRCFFITVSAGKGCVMLKACFFALAIVLAAISVFLAPVAGSAGNPALAPLSGVDAASSHEPYLSGDCAVCHDPAAPSADSPGKVYDELSGRCVDCHGELAEAVKSSRLVHAPTLTGCVACHNPHDSPHAGLLLEQPKNLCLGCHGEMKQIIAMARFQHEPVNDEAACLNCHNPHASDTRSLLNRQPFDLCLSCHSEDNRTGSSGQPLTNFGRLLAERPYQHGPVAGQSCGTCHLSHGSDTHSLLTAGYPAGFYASYAPDTYALCFNCHGSQNMVDPETTTATRFRDGSRNLHYLHVNKSGRGRSCRACHEVHASKNPSHIRDAVPFGPRNWLLAINHTRTDTGGFCARTCHQTKSYDRSRRE